MIRFTPVEHDIRTLYVPEDFIERLAARATAGDLLPGFRRVPMRVARRRGNHVQVRVDDGRAAHILLFNVVDVWRVDEQTIQYRVHYRARRGEAIRALWDSTPAPGLVALMLPVIAALAVLVPELVLMPVFGLATARPGRTPPLLGCIGQRLKAIADGSA